MKKILSSFTALAITLALAGAAFAPHAQAAVNLTAGPTSLVPNPIAVPANSAPTPLFTFTLNSTSGENLTGVMLQVSNPNTSTPVSTQQIGQFSIYKDNGSGIFNSDSANLVGSQSNVMSNSSFTVTPNTFTSATGKFYVTFGSSFFWTGPSAQNTIVVTMPNNAINTSANSPITPAISTATISASGSIFPVLVSATAMNTGGTSALEAGDSIVLAFSKAMNKFGVSSNNIGSQFTVSNGHSFLDSLGNLGNATWNSDGTLLTISFSAPSSLTSASAPTVRPGDVITMAQTTGIADLSGNRATGSATVTGNFGTILPGSNGPQLSAQLSSTSPGVGMPVFDTAVFGGVSANASGTVTYNVFSGSDCSGPVIFSNIQTVNGASVPASSGFAASTAGTYSWQATYSGDGINPSLVGPCQPEFVSAASSGAVPATLPAGTSGSGSLPVTGMPVGVIFLGFAVAAGLVDRKFKLI